MSAFCKHINDDATALQHMLPKWRLFFKDGKMNEAMLKKHVLQHENKKDWSRLAGNLEEFVENAVAASVCLVKQPSFTDDDDCIGAKDMADDAIAQAYECMAVAAACKAILIQGDTPDGSKTARGTLEIITTMTEFDCPKILMSRLHTLATASHAKEEPAVKKQRVSQPEVGGASAPASSVAPALAAPAVKVKLEPVSGDCA